jgi:hypothetical protein
MWSVIALRLTTMTDGMVGPFTLRERAVVDLANVVGRRHHRCDVKVWFAHGQASHVAMYVRVPVQYRHHHRALAAAAAAAAVVTTTPSLQQQRERP